MANSSKKPARFDADVAFAKFDQRTPIEAAIARAVRKAVEKDTGSRRATSKRARRTSR